MTGKLAVVFGGSGFIGRNVVRELAKRGWRVRVGVRRPHLAQFLKPMGAVGQIQLTQVNVRNAESVATATAGADAVINLVGILHEEGRQTFSSVQAEGSANIAQAAAQNGVEQFVHVSAIGADANSESEYAQTKAAGEAAVREHMPNATILRPSVVFGTEDQFFNRFATMAITSPFTPIPLIGGGKTRFQPIYVDDIADAICESLANSDAAGRIFELGGPQVYSFKELMTLMLAEIQRDRPLVDVPFFAAEIIGNVGDIVGRLPFVEPPLTFDQVRLLKTDNIVRAEDGVGSIRDLGIEPTAIEAVLPSYMERYRRYGQFAPKHA